MRTSRNLENRLVPVLLALGGLLWFSGPGTSPAAFAQADGEALEPGVIESLSISNVAAAALVGADGADAAGVSETRLIVATSSKLEWTARWLPSGNFRLSLPTSGVANGVVDLAFDEGLIAAVDVSSTEDGGSAATTLEISLRDPAKVSATAGPNRIELIFRARPPEPGPLPELAEVADTGADEFSGEYRIGPGDLLEISVFGLDDFNRTVRVLRDGSISLPLLGGLRVLDMTLEQAQGTVADLLTRRQLVNKPEVTFFVKEYVSRGVSVQGAVERPGIYQMIQQRSLLEMLGEAGGLSGRENDRAGQQIFVIRETSDGEQTRIEIDADQLVNQGRADLNIPLVPGDVVLVPFAQKYRIYVSGAVARPGPVDFLSSEGITVLQAITAAGGPTERGNIGNVKILRKLADGSETRIVVNVKKIRKGAREDVPLERNDTVIVGEWFF